MIYIFKNFGFFATLLLTIILFAIGQDTDTIQTSGNDAKREEITEAAIKLVQVLNPGEREYLSPNLIGVQNIAMTFLPLTMNFINIIDAFREIVNGVRYEILLNANNTKNNNIEVVCRLVILEKPWLTTQWGDKVRELQSTNCTNDESGMNDFIEKKNVVNDQIKTNPIFNSGARNELTDDEMSDLEAQIISATSDSRPTNSARRSTSTSTTTTISTVTNSDLHDDDNVNSESGNNVKIKTNIKGNKNLTKNTSTSTNVDENETEIDFSQLPELSENEKKWLDDIFTVGALNFESLNPRHNRNQNGEPIIVVEDINETAINTDVENNHFYVQKQQLKQQDQQLEVQLEKTDNLQYENKYETQDINETQTTKNQQHDLASEPAKHDY